MIGHLLFAHMLADYMLQTNWLVSRKGQKWDGLALHGFMVWVMSLLVLPAYFPVVVIPITIMALLHTAQDWLKVYLTPRLPIPGFYSYMADQFGHYAMILILQLVVGPHLIPPPDVAEQYVMGLGACVMALTRFYEVTWWSNFLRMKMLPYFNRWRWFEYAEHLAMFALTVAGYFYVAPLCLLPRLFEGWRTGQPIWKQKYGVREMVLGAVFSIALGLVMYRLYPDSLR